MADQSELLRAPLETLPVGAVADEQEPGVDALLPQRRERGEEVAGLLHTRHAAQPADDEALRRDAEPPADLVPRLVAADTLLQLDPEPHDDELLGRRHTRGRRGRRAPRG